MPFDLPFQPTLPHMLAKAADAIPAGAAWRYEPKWDGFRALVFYDGESMLLQSRDQKPLGRYFPELEAGLRAVLPPRLVLDGEIVIATDHGLDFDALQLRIHPAESRVRLLAAQTPASFVAFDLLALDGVDLRAEPFDARRQRLEAILDGVGEPVHLTPETTDAALAQDWFERFEGAGLDGVVAKQGDQPYQPGARGWLKIKHLRTVDCVVGGYRWNRGEEGRSVGSLLLGLYDGDRVFHFVGHTSSFKAAEKRELVGFLAPYIAADAAPIGPHDTAGAPADNVSAEGFGHGRTPGGGSRWTGGRDMSWTRLRPELVCEVTFDYLQGPRFRHAATFRRWRTDKPPTACAFDQIATTPPYELQQVFGAM